MGSKKKPASFEIPDTVRHAGQSGWVYRTEGNAAGHPPAARRTRAAAVKHATRPAPKHVRQHAPAAPIEHSARAPLAPTLPVAPPVAPAPDTAVPAASSTPAGGLIGFSLQVAAVPFVVPLYLTAAISRRLGFVNER